MKWKILAGLVAIALSLLVLATMLSVRPVSLSLSGSINSMQVLDRHGTPLTISYQGQWNIPDQVKLHNIPEFLQNAFIQSEDKRFWHHEGVDWSARSSAIWQNIRHGRTIRGASTITEQVVRMIHPRPRNIWSKYIEGFEAAALERRYSKAEIFEFYLNQAPYASNRRGVAQAARYYFDRHLSTLTEREMLALVVLARAPSAYDLYRHPEKTKKAVDRLALLITNDPSSRILKQEIRTVSPSHPVEARHFARFIRTQKEGNATRIISTLDAGLQNVVQQLLDQRIQSLSGKKVRNGAALILDHTSGEVLAWVVAGAGQNDVDAHDIDAVTVPRQPGSAIKPFLYARALDKGWNAAMFLDDSPLSEAVGKGLHRFHNYSRTYYGPISLREALGNSLNIPALLTIRYVGTADYLTILSRLGFHSLDRGSDIYDEGLALGNGEVTLLELVKAYAVLANRGMARPLRYQINDSLPRTEKQIYTQESASLIGNILSDPWARYLEFGQGSVLNLPVQTAVKTGTSTDYRDAWVVGYNDRYVVGIWMGNLDHTPMDGVTGSTGPALVMRGIFSRLNQSRETRKLFLSPNLVQKDVCVRPEAGCLLRSEWVRPNDIFESHSLEKKNIEMVRPTEGLQLAYDPRIPENHQKFKFEIQGLASGDRVEWMVNDESLGITKEGVFLWPVRRGPQTMRARVMKPGGQAFDMAVINFLVK